ncbi:MAG: histidine phosphatase family protein [Actinomycetota bacterium]|nr:histidine phosphatase family protein [Actinomycetota bacterium]
MTDGIELWLIRHGETEWSRSGRHTGRTDVSLTAAGEAQAAALTPLFAGLHPALVLCSPRERAQATARLAGLAITSIDEDLAEWDYGDYEGRTTAEIREQVPGWTLWTDGVPNGETADQVSARADRVLLRAASKLSAGPVILIAHGHICRVIGARWIGLPATGGARLALGTAAPSVLGSQHGIPVIDRWNIPNPLTANGGLGD